MMKTERPPTSDSKEAFSTKHRHRKRKERYWQAVNIGVPKGSTRRQPPIPSHETLSDWMEAS